MSQSRIARRYAEALLLSAEEQKLTDRVSEDLRRLKELSRTSKDFQLFLRSPVIRHEKKQEVLRMMFSASLAPVMVQFLDLLAHKGREGDVVEIADEYFRLLDVKRGIVPLEVRAAKEIDSTRMERIKQLFEARTQKNVRIEFALDPSVRGGFIARVGDTVFDGTVRHQLDVLRRRFAEPS